MRLEIDVFGEKLVSRELIFRAIRLEHPAPFFEGAARFLERVMRAQFDTEGAYASTRWDLLQPATIARKARMGHSPDILRATGALERSLTQKGAPHAKRRISENALVFGTDLDYLVYHQSPAPRHVIPRRVVVALTAMDRKHLERGLTFWITRGAVWPPLLAP